MSGQKEEKKQKKKGFFARTVDRVTKFPTSVKTSMASGMTKMFIDSVMSLTGLSFDDYIDHICESIDVILEVFLAIAISHKPCKSSESTTEDHTAVFGPIPETVYNKECFEKATNAMEILYVMRLKLKTMPFSDIVSETTKGKLLPVDLLDAVVEWTPDEKHKLEKNVDFISFVVDTLYRYCEGIFDNIDERPAAIIPSLYIELEDVLLAAEYLTGCLKLAMSVLENDKLTGMMSCHTYESVRDPAKAQELLWDVQAIAVKYNAFFRKLYDMVSGLYEEVEASRRQFFRNKEDTSLINYQNILADRTKSIELYRTAIFDRIPQIIEGISSFNTQAEIANYLLEQIGELSDTPPSSISSSSSSSSTTKRDREVNFFGGQSLTQPSKKRKLIEEMVKNGSLLPEESILEKHKRDYQPPPRPERIKRKRSNTLNPKMEDI